jgi:hypothetical protein
MVCYGTKAAWWETRSSDGPSLAGYYCYSHLVGRPAQVVFTNPNDRWPGNRGAQGVADDDDGDDDQEEEEEDDDEFRTLLGMH